MLKNLLNTGVTAKAILAMIAAFLVFSPSIADAQGCPWCTTPTKCERV